MTHQNEQQRFNASFERLNDMQKQAVMTTDGALLLLAGAGSGKTTVLINRIANLLINKDISPYEIIAITFTNKAAGEMKERLERMGIPGAENVWASTFHSACAKILRRDIDKLGYDKSFTIYDTNDCVSLIKRIIKEQGLDDKTFTPKQVLGNISRAKDEMKTPQDFIRSAERNADMHRRYIGYIFEEYEKRMKAANALDFDDLILLTVHLFKAHPDVLRYYQNRFKYVLVDEYQDTNKLQYLLTSALAGGYGNICVVGDDDQSIYKFRGATIENILSFEDHFKDAEVIRLEQNYRSTGAILNAANEVIKNNVGRKGKKLWTENENGEKPILSIVPNEQAEAQFVTDEIDRSVRDGRKWQDHVILYRMNAQSFQFEAALRRNGIPYKVYGGTGFYERAEIKDMLAYLCVIHNPYDDIRLLRIINTPTRGLGDTTVERLRTIALDLGISLYEAIREAHKYENMQSAVPKLLKFTEMIEELRELNSPEKLDELYDELLKKTGYVRVLREKKTEENLSRIENVEELKTSIITFMNENGGTLFDFLSETALYTDLDRDVAGNDHVMLMTMHSAKGLEFDTVFIVGAEDGMFPGERVMNFPEEIEEERRLCYVAMTRAMRKLYFTSAQQRMIFGTTRYGRISRFVREINPDNIVIVNSSASSWSPMPMRDVPRQNTFIPRQHKVSVPVLEISEGDEITHKTFGKGVVKSVSPAGTDALLVIEFETVGTKQLLKNSAAQFISKQ